MYGISFKKVYKLAGLEEDLVFEEINAVLNFQNLRQDVFEIIQNVPLPFFQYVPLFEAGFPLQKYPKP